MPTYYGLYRSDDGGDSYAPVNPAPFARGDGGRTVNPTLMVVDPTDEMRLFTAGGRDVFLSEDGGSTFVPRSTGLPTSGGWISWLSMNRSDPDNLQAVFSDGRVFRTPDGGASWTLRFDLDLGGSSIVEATQDPATGHVFLATSTAGVISSHPNFNPGSLPTTALETIHFSPAQNTLLLGTVYAGALHQVIAPPIAVPESADRPPGEVALSVLPNPSTGATRIEFSVPEPGAEVHLAIHDASGRRVRNLIDERMPPGPWSLTWDGRSTRGARVPAGVYFVRLEIAGEVTTSKTIRLR